MSVIMPGPGVVKYILIPAVRSILLLAADQPCDLLPVPLSEPGLEIQTDGTDHISSVGGGYISNKVR